MATSRIGMDTDHGQVAGTSFQANADEIREAAQSLRSQVNALYYEGPEAQQFRSDFESRHYRNLITVADQADALGQHLRTKAQQFNEVGNR
jgi:uncharacterized protein YukE